MFDIFHNAVDVFQSVSFEQGQEWLQPPLEAMKQVFHLHQAAPQLLNTGLSSS